MKLNLGIESGSPRLELYPRDVLSACDLGTNLLKQGIIEGENPVFDTDYRGFVVRSQRVELFGNAAQNGW